MKRYSPYVKSASGLNIKCTPRLDTPDILYGTTCKINSALWNLRQPDMDQFKLFAMTEVEGQRLLAELKTELKKVAL